MHIDDLQLLQSDVEGLELAVVPVQWDHLEQPVIESQADHAALWVYYSDDTGLRWASDTILKKSVWKKFNIEINPMWFVLRLLLNTV